MEMQELVTRLEAAEKLIEQLRRELLIYSVNTNSRLKRMMRKHSKLNRSVAYDTMTIFEYAEELDVRLGKVDTFAHHHVHQ